MYSHKCIFILLWLIMGFERQAIAACSYGGGSASPTDMSIHMPSSLNFTAVPIGGVLARVTQAYDSGARVVTCTTTQAVTFSLDNGGMEESQLGKVYKSGIEGVGVRFEYGVADHPGLTIDSLPSMTGVEPGISTVLPRRFFVSFIRIGSRVKSGSTTVKFSAVYKVPGLPSLRWYSVGGPTELINNVFWAGCAAVDAVTNVSMGKELASNIETGTAASRPFSFDVRCEGLANNGAPPVKVYFEGDTLADGSLRLSEQGQSGVASGVGISLQNDKGAKLPFKKADALQLAWNRTDEQGEVYRFSGSAKYSLIGGGVKPGRANAILNYVIEYN